MLSHEIFQQMGPEKSREILMFFRDNERNIYKSAISSLAERKKLRPVFVMQKSVPDQLAWLQKELVGKRSDSVAEQLLQVWLLQARQAMLIKFLDGVGIPHDGKGAIDTLPDTLDAAKLATTIDSLTAEFDPREVAIYLHIFQAQTASGWPELATVLADDKRLALG